MMETFKEFHKRITTATGKKIKRVHSDNEAIFNSKEMNEFLFATARAMLMSSKLGKLYWGYAIEAASYTLNRLPMAAIDDRSPYEAWRGFKPKLKHLRVFGCDVFVHDKQGKLVELEDGKVTTTRDVQFMETKLLSRSRKCQRGTARTTLRSTTRSKSFQQVEAPQLQGRQPRRSTRPAASTVSVKKAIDDPKWRKAMDEEMKAHRDNGTKWVLRQKDDGRYKARLVARGDLQREEEYFETYAPVARETTIRVVMAITERRGRHGDLHGAAAGLREGVRRHGAQAQEGDLRAQASGPQVERDHHQVSA